MSSSKVFKKDALFTPIPLVRQTLVLPKKTREQAVASPWPPSSTDPVPQAEAAREEPVKGTAPRAGIEPEPAADLEAIRLAGYNQGMADLAAQYQAEFQQTIEAFADACRKIDSQRRKIQPHCRGDLINLIIGLCEKILGQELLTPRNVIASTLQAAMEQAIVSEEYYVTLHPGDLAFAEAKVPELITAIRGLERIVFKTDGSMTRGGCLLESAVCTADATIEAQLAGMKEFLQEQATLLQPLEEEEPSASGSASDESRED